MLKLQQLLSYISSLALGKTFTYRSACIACFGHPFKNRYLASKLQIYAFRNRGYIIISSTASGANIYKRT